MTSVIYKSIEFCLYILGKSYVPTYWIIKALCGFSKNIWIRNSVFFGNQIFYLSDIDFTILDNRPEKLIGRINFLKKIFLMIGEVNVYKKAHLPYFMETVNPCELARDPILEKYSKRAVVIENSDALVFLLRSYQSDLQNLKRWPWVRVRKWNGHLGFLKQYFSISPSQQLFDVIEHLSNDRIIKEDVLLTNSMLFPHVWFSKHYSYDELRTLGTKCLEESDLIKDVFRKQLSWEFSGVLSQICIINDNQEVRNHFMNIVTILHDHEDNFSIKLKSTITSFCNNELQDL
jgi:hypothetical protein